MRRDQQRLNDILDALDWIANAISRRTEAEFLADETLCYAVAQRLTVIGEAVARLTPDITDRHKSIPWPGHRRAAKHLGPRVPEGACSAMRPRIA
jgi:uncharacterized protein with HEPN domain